MNVRNLTEKYEMNIEKFFFFLSMFSTNS